MTRAGGLAELFYRNPVRALVTAVRGRYGTRRARLRQALNGKQGSPRIAIDAMGAFAAVHESESGTNAKCRLY